MSRGIEVHWRFLIGHTNEAAVDKDLYPYISLRSLSQRDIVLKKKYERDEKLFFKAFAFHRETLRYLPKVTLSPTGGECILQLAVTQRGLGKATRSFG